MRPRLLPLLLLACIAPAASAQAPPVWSPNPAQAQNLAAETVLQHCAFRPPAGYVLLKTTSFKSGRKEYEFLGPRRPDGSAPTLLIAPQTLAETGLNWSVPAAMADLQRHLNGPIELDKSTETQAGRVGGQPALRFYGRGRQAVNLYIGGPGIKHWRLAHLIVYGIGDDEMSVTALAADQEPHDAPYNPAALNTMEASLQTLRLTDPPAAPAALYPGQWMPDALRLHALLPEAPAGPLRLRVPRGFVQVGLKQSDPNTALFGWQEQSGADPATLRVLVMPRAPNAPPPVFEGLKAFAERVLAGEKDGEQNFRATPISYGATFLGTSGRFTATGVYSPNGRPVQRTATFYVVQTATQTIELVAATDDPNGGAALLQVEAAILSARYGP